MGYRFDAIGGEQEIVAYVFNQYRPDHVEITGSPVDGEFGGVDAVDAFEWLAVKNLGHKDRGIGIELQHGIQTLIVDEGRYLLGCESDKWKLDLYQNKFPEADFIGFLTYNQAVEKTKASGVERTHFMPLIQYPLKFCFSDVAYDDLPGSSEPYNPY